MIAIYSSHRLKLVGAFLVAVFVGQMLGGLLVFADHGTVVGQNRICFSDGDYYHTHWYREEDPGIRPVAYKINIVYEGGNPGAYAPIIRNEANEWNAEQVLIRFNETTGTYNFKVTVDNYGTEFAGQAVLDPDQCDSPQNNQTTHVNDSGSTIVRINSFAIESSSYNSTDKDKYRHWTASHELGHIMGLGHNATSPTTDQVMYPGAFQPSGPTGPMTRDITQLTDPEDDTSGNDPVDPQGHDH